MAKLKFGWVITNNVELLFDTVDVWFNHITVLKHIYVLTPKGINLNIKIMGLKSTFYNKMLKRLIKKRYSFEYFFV